MTSGIFDVQFVETPTNERTNGGYIYKKKTQYFFKVITVGWSYIQQFPQKHRRLTA